MANQQEAKKNKEEPITVLASLRWDSEALRHYIQALERSMQALNLNTQAGEVKASDIRLRVIESKIIIAVAGQDLLLNALEFCAGR